MQDDSSRERESRSIYDDMKKHYKDLGIEIPDGWVLAILDEYITKIRLCKEKASR